VYLRLKPNADDRAALLALLPSLRRAKFSAGQAFALGIVIPGAGQFYTQRPVWGTTLLLAEGAAIGVAFIPQTKIENVPATGTDPFGNPYTFTSRRRVTNHPVFVPAMATAGVLAIIGASEAYMYANKMNTSPVRRVSVVVIPAMQSAVAMRITF
jgi:TM2 domain-containing membrane protein YozV